MYKRRKERYIVPTNTKSGSVDIIIPYGMQNTLEMEPDIEIIGLISTSYRKVATKTSRAVDTKYMREYISGIVEMDNGHAGLASVGISKLGNEDGDGVRNKITISSLNNHVKYIEFILSYNSVEEDE